MIEDDSLSRGGVPVLPSAGLEAVMAERMRQILQFRHTPETDRQTRLIDMPLRARGFLNAIVDDCQFGKPRDHMRRHAVRAAAMLVAFIDRIDADDRDAA